MLLSCSILPLQCMEHHRQRLYPLVPVLHANVQKADEQVHLLTHDFLEKDGQTFAHAAPPSYQELYISKEDSDAELKRLRDLLTKKEQELETVSKKLPHKLSVLERKRKVENHNSNIVIGSLAGGYYLVDTVALGFAVPHPTEDNKIKIMVYCLHGLASAVAAGFVAVVNAGEKGNG